MLFYSLANTGVGVFCQRDQSYLGFLRFLQDNVYFCQG